LRVVRVRRRQCQTVHVDRSAEHSVRGVIRERRNHATRVGSSHLTAGAVVSPRLQRAEIV
jgi:hypothetical protein